MKRCVGTCLLVAALVACAKESAAEIFLLEDVNASEFGGEIGSCTHPEVAINDTCTCAPGFTWRNSQCSSCERGKYKPEDGLHECTACPAHHSSLENATEAEDCFCVIGYERTDPATCRACLTGFYKDFVGDGMCLPCTSNASTFTPQGVPITASVSQTDCKCVAGYEGAFDTGCNACAVDYFKAPDTPDQACVPCTHVGVNLATLGTASDAAADCMCKPGFFLTPEGVCTQCVAGTYKPEIGMLTQCSTCPANSFSPAASKTVEDCVCDPGFFRVDGTTGFSCVLCPSNFYCPGLGQKLQCMLNSLSPAGSTSLDSCTCVSSMYKLADACFTCPPDFFCVGDNTKEACPENSQSPAGSDSLAQCVCDGGFQKQA